MGYMYILECCDGSYYTGSTKNLEKRLWLRHFDRLSVRSSATFESFPDRSRRECDDTRQPGSLSGVEGNAMIHGLKFKRGFPNTRGGV